MFTGKIKLWAIIVLATFSVVSGAYLLIKNPSNIKGAGNAGSDHVFTVSPGPQVPISAMQIGGPLVEVTNAYINLTAATSIRGITVHMNPERSPTASSVSVRAYLIDNQGNDRPKPLGTEHVLNANGSYTFSGAGFPVVIPEGGDPQDSSISIWARILNQGDIAGKKLSLGFTAKSDIQLGNGDSVVLSPSVIWGKSLDVGETHTIGSRVDRVEGSSIPIGGAFTEVNSIVIPTTAEARLSSVRVSFNRSIDTPLPNNAVQTRLVLTGTDNVRRELPAQSLNASGQAVFDNLNFRMRPDGASVIISIEAKVQGAAAELRGKKLALGVAKRADDIVITSPPGHAYVYDQAGVYSGKVMTAAANAMQAVVNAAAGNNNVQNGVEVIEGAVVGAAVNGVAGNAGGAGANGTVTVSLAANTPAGRVLNPATDSDFLDVAKFTFTPNRNVALSSLTVAYNPSVQNPIPRTSIRVRVVTGQVGSAQQTSSPRIPTNGTADFAFSGDMDLVQGRTYSLAIQAKIEAPAQAAGKRFALGILHSNDFHFATNGVTTSGIPLVGLMGNAFSVAGGAAGQEAVTQVTLDPATPAAGTITTSANNTFVDVTKFTIRPTDDVVVRSIKVSFKNGLANPIPSSALELRLMKRAAGTYIPLTEITSFPANSRSITFNTFIDQTRISNPETWDIIIVARVKNNAVAAGRNFALGILQKEDITTTLENIGEIPAGGIMGNVFSVRAAGEAAADGGGAGAGDLNNSAGLTVELAENTPPRRTLNPTTDTDFLDVTKLTFSANKDIRLDAIKVALKPGVANPMPRTALKLRLKINGGPFRLETTQERGIESNGIAIFTFARAKNLAKSTLVTMTIQAKVLNPLTVRGKSFALGLKKADNFEFSNRDIAVAGIEGEGLMGNIFTVAAAGGGNAPSAFQTACESAGGQFIEGGCTTAFGNLNQRQLAILVDCISLVGRHFDGATKTCVEEEPREDREEEPIDEPDPVDPVDPPARVPSAEEIALNERIRQMEAQIAAANAAAANAANAANASANAAATAEMQRMLAELEAQRRAIVPAAAPATVTTNADAGRGTTVSSTLTCESLGQHTFTGPSSPTRTNGMCIDCTTEVFVANGGKCTSESEAVGTANNGRTAANELRSAAVTNELDLGGSQRLVRAPERGNTGPSVLVYFGLMGIAQAGYFARAHFKKRRK